MKSQQPSSPKKVSPSSAKKPSPARPKRTTAVPKAATSTTGNVNGKEDGGNDPDGSSDTLVGNFSRSTSTIAPPNHHVDDNMTIEHSTTYDGGGGGPTNELDQELAEGRDKCADPNLHYTVQYPWKRTGQFLAFNCTLEAIQCFGHGLFAGARIRITKGSYKDVEATVIGVRDNFLWRHDDGERGAGAFNCQTEVDLQQGYGLLIIGAAEMPNIRASEKPQTKSSKVKRSKSSNSSKEGSRPQSSGGAAVRRHDSLMDLLHRGDRQLSHNSNHIVESSADSDDDDDQDYDEGSVEEDNDLKKDRAFRNWIYSHPRMLYSSVPRYLQFTHVPIFEPFVYLLPLSGRDWEQQGSTTPAAPEFGMYDICASSMREYATKHAPPPPLQQSSNLATSAASENDLQAAMRVAAANAMRCGRVFLHTAGARRGSTCTIIGLFGGRLVRQYPGDYPRMFDSVDPFIDAGLVPLNFENDVIEAPTCMLLYESVTKSQPHNNNGRNNKGEPSIIRSGGKGMVRQRSLASMGKQYTTKLRSMMSDDELEANGKSAPSTILEEMRVCNIDATFFLPRDVVLETPPDVALGVSIPKTIYSDAVKFWGLTYRSPPLFAMITGITHGMRILVSSKSSSILSGGGSSGAASPSSTLRVASMSDRYFSNSNASTSNNHNHMTMGASSTTTIASKSSPQVHRVPSNAAGGPNSGATEGKPGVPEVEVEAWRSVLEQMSLPQQYHNTPLVVIGFRSFVSGSVFDVYTWATDLLSVLDSTTLSRLPSTIQTILTKAANYHQGGSSHSSNHPPHKPESAPYLFFYCERDDVIVAGTLLDVIGSGRTQIIGAQLGPIVTQQLCTPEEVMLQCCEPISKLVEQQRHFISVSIGTEGGGGGAFVRSPSAVGDNESELALMRQSTSTGSEQHQLRGASGFQGVPAEEELVERCVSKHIIWGNASTTRYVDSVVDDIPESVTKLKAAVDAYKGAKVSPPPLVVTSSTASALSSVSASSLSRHRSNAGKGSGNNNNNTSSFINTNNQRNLQTVGSKSQIRTISSIASNWVDKQSYSVLQHVQLSVDVRGTPITLGSTITILTGIWFGLRGVVVGKYLCEEGCDVCAVHNNHASATGGAETQQARSFGGTATTLASPPPSYHQKRLSTSSSWRSSTHLQILLSATEEVVSISCDLDLVSLQPYQRLAPVSGNGERGGGRGGGNGGSSSALFSKTRLSETGDEKTAGGKKSGSKQGGTTINHFTWPSIFGDLLTVSTSTAATLPFGLYFMQRIVCRDRGVHQQGCYTSHQQGCYTTTTSSSRAAVAYNKPLPPDAFTSSPLEPLRPPRPSTTTLLSFDDEDNSSSKLAALPPWRKGTVAGVWMDIVWVLDDNSMMLEPLYGPFETFRTRYEIVITGLLDTVPAFRDPLLNVESVVYCPRGLSTQQASLALHGSSGGRQQQPQRGGGLGSQESDLLPQIGVDALWRQPSGNPWFIGLCGIQHLAYSMTPVSVIISKQQHHEMDNRLIDPTLSITMGSFRPKSKSKPAGNEFHIVCTNELAACHGYDNSEQFFNAICRGAEKVGRLVSRTPPHMAEIVVMINRGGEGLDQLLRRHLLHNKTVSSTHQLQHQYSSTKSHPPHHLVTASSSASISSDSSLFSIGDVIVRDDRLDNPVFEFGKWRHHEDKKRAQVTGTLLGSILGVFEGDPRRQQRKYQYVIACAPLLSNDLHRWKAEECSGSGRGESNHTNFLALNPALGVSGGSGGGGGATPVNAHHARSPLGGGKSAFRPQSANKQQQQSPAGNVFEFDGCDLDDGNDEDDPTLLVNLLRSDRTAPIPLPPQLHIAPPRAYTNATLTNTVVENMKKQRAATTMDLLENGIDEEDALRAAGIAPPPVKTVTQQLFGVLTSMGVCGKEINHPSFNPDDRVNRTNFDSGLGRGVVHDTTAPSSSSAYERISYGAAEIRSFYDPFPCRKDLSRPLDLQDCVNLVSPIIAECAARCKEDPNWPFNDDEYTTLIEEKLFCKNIDGNNNNMETTTRINDKRRSRHTPPYSMVWTFFRGTPPARIPAILNLMRLGCYLSELGRGESIKSGIISLMILVDALGPSCGGVFPALPSEDVWAQHQRLCLLDAEQTLRQRIESEELDVLGTMQIGYQSGLDAIRRLLYDSSTPSAQALVPPPSNRWGVDEQVLHSGKKFLPSAWAQSRQDLLQHSAAMHALEGGYEESMLSVRSATSTAFTASPTTRVGRSLSTALIYGKDTTLGSGGGGGSGVSHHRHGGGGGVQIEDALAFLHPSNRLNNNDSNSNGHHRQKPINFTQLPSTIAFMNNECNYPFEYILSCGSRAVFDISSEACRRFEMYHGQRFKYTKGDLSGSILTIIGVCGGRLWRYSSDTEAAPFSGRNAAEIVLLHGLEYVGGGGGGASTAGGGNNMKTPYSTNLSPLNSPTAISLEIAAVAPSFSKNHDQGGNADAPTMMVPVPVPTSVRSSDTFMYHTTEGHVVAFNVADEDVHGEFGVRFGDRFAVRDTLALRTICNVNIVPRKRTTTTLTSSLSPVRSPGAQKTTILGVGGGGGVSVASSHSQEPYNDIPFGRITIIGIREGRLWFETCSSGAQPFLGNSGSLRLELNLQYLYSGAVSSSFANMARGSTIRICYLSKVGRVAVDTSPGAIAQFCPDVRSGTAVIIAKGALVGLRTVIVGVRHGRLLHQPHGTGQCTPFEYPYSTLMRHVRFTVYRGVHDVESLEDVVLREPVGIARQKCFKYLSLSGDVYSFDTTDSACGHVYGFGHGDRLQLTKPAKQAGRLVVVLGVRHGHMWCIDELDGSAFVLHGCVDHQSVVATFAPIVCGRSSIKEFTG